MKKIILGIAIVVLLPQQGYALEFDIWITGQTKKKMVAKAKKNKIELNTRTPKDQQDDVINNVYYHDTLFQEKAMVSLVFTPQNNLLYAIEIDWKNIATTARGEALAEKIGATLGKKYIQNEEIAGNSLIQHNNKTFNNCSTATTTYKGGISSTLFRCDGKRFMSVRYKDAKLEKQNTFEQKKVLKTRDEDSKKF